MANFIVTNLNNSGAGSLRDAVTKANANADADTITFAVGGTITLTSELALTNDVTIDGDINGDDKADVVISGGNTTRIINQSGASTDVQLLSLTLANGNATGPNPDGGAILVNYGSLLIGNTTLRNNVAGDDGGAIRTQGTVLTIYNSLLHTNSAAHGGALYIDGATTTTIYSSTIHNNIASVNGGGVYIDGGNTLNLTQSTVTSNSADADNNGSGDGGGIFLFSATESMNIINTVVASNFDAAVANDVRGTIGNSNHSVFGAAVTITNNVASLQNVGNPGLNSLSERGGTVLSQNMIAESVLINAGLNNGNLPTVDVNGNPRIVAGTVDVGATEFQLVVTTSLDTVANDGFLSLREAVALANVDAGADVITFSANIAGSTITLGSVLGLNTDITIDGDTDGDNAADITISGGNTTQIFSQLGATTDVDLLSLTLVNGVTSFSGGAISSVGGTLDIRDTTFSNNLATTRGGAVFANGTLMSINSSLFALNSAQDGGGIYVIGGQATTMTNSTVLNNTATNRGGGVYVDGNADFRNCTITDNRSDSDGNGADSGGGVFKFFDTGETLRLFNSVLANNINGSGSTLQDVNTGTSSQIFGLDSAFSTSADVSVNGGTQLNLTNAQLDLGALNINGGTVLTRALGSNSVLIDAGRNAYAANTATDATGGNRIAGNRVDIGAVEQQLQVTNTNDSGFGSLRAAVDAANANADHHTITFAANLAGQTITLLSQLTLSTDITIDGDVNNDNKADVTLSGGGVTRIIDQIGSDTDVKLLSLTLTGGSSTDGGAISANGSNGSSLEIRNSSLIDNSASSRGGALASFNVATTVINTLVQDNSASRGGGMYFFDDASTVVNSTVVNNTASGTGGGIYIDGNLTVLNSTITGNRANSDGIGTEGGGGIFKYSQAGETLTIINTVLAENIKGTGTTLNDVNSGVEAQIVSNTSAFGTAAGASVTNASGTLFSQTAAQLALGELLDNGGTVLTRSMLDGSVLISEGNAGLLTTDTFDIDADGNTAELLPLDGRGGPRVTGGVDIGAVEQRIDETIRGTNGFNVLIGGLGIDDLNGLGGDDIISGGASADKIDGGAETDIADYRTSTGTNVSVNLLLDTASGGHAQGDTLDNIEGLWGSLTQRDILIGDTGNNFIKGFGGNDSLQGGDGDDVIEGGAGGDAINGGAGTSDTASYRDSNTGTVSINLLTATYSGGDAQGDTLFFIENLEGSLTRRDILVGNNVVNRIFGNGGVDSIRGEGGNDFIDGGAGGDSLNAGAGIDTLSYEKSSAGVTVNLNVALQVSAGDANGDSLFFFENVIGSNGVDTITGNYQSNRLTGGLGTDTLNGGTGSDYLTGGEAADTFRFSDLSFGADTILDWQDGVDKISVAPVLESSFAGLTFTGNGTTSVIVRGFNGMGSAITVKADAAFTLDASDFMFV